MNDGTLTMSIVIPTYGREGVLTDTIEQLLAQTDSTPGFIELIVVDQTARHAEDTQARLDRWRQDGRIRWIHFDIPHLTRAMNHGLQQAAGQIVLFVDDDIIPCPDLLIQHLDAYRRIPDLWGIVGQVLQPGEKPEVLPYTARGGALRRYMDFPYRRTEGAFIENAIACNFSVVRDKAIALGGFDENYGPPVASRFETEFAKRLIKAGGRIWFEPKASIRHLRAPSGGTRSQGSHMSSASPCFGVGDYYFALKHDSGWEQGWYILKRPFREIRTRFHLRHPWWIPVKFVGELRAIAEALSLHRRGPQLIRVTPSTSQDSICKIADGCTPG